MKRRALILGAVAAAVVTAAAVYLTLQPATRIPRLLIYLDKDKCKRCGMVISRQEFAAGLFVEGMDDWWKYDDVGCMLKDYIENSERVKVLAAAVFDYYTKEQLDAMAANYVKADPKKLWTPMSSGIVAAKDSSVAEQIAHKYDGHVYSWQKIIEEVKKEAKSH
ncbi:MAG: nitrous oxide reductase accessory protein NosL, partial [Nitrososphaerota archaeon]